MDVHPPHEPIHSWRDFLLHLATITVGLLIAIALEQTVEALHHRHQRMETRENLRREIMENRETFAADLRAIAGEKKMLEANIAALRRLRSKQPVAPDALHFAWSWNSMQDSAWQTAHETTAIALFPNEQVQHYSVTYAQQSNVNQAGIALSHSITAAEIPLTVQPDLNSLTPAQIDELIRNCAASLNQIEFLSGVTASLDGFYQAVLRED